jgi:hypothetical protein
MADLGDEVTVHFRGREGRELWEHLYARVGRRSGPVITRRDLRRYYSLLADALKTVSLTYGEAMLIVNACRFGARSGLVLELVQRVRDEQLDLVHQVDSDQLIAKLEGYSELQLVAIEDAVERYWIGVERPKEAWQSDPTVESVGLVGPARRHASDVL